MSCLLKTSRQNGPIRSIAECTKMLSAIWSVPEKNGFEVRKQFVGSLGSKKSSANIFPGGKNRIVDEKLLEGKEEEDCDDMISHSRFSDKP